MSRPELFDHLLVSLHEAALDDARWPAAAAQIDRLCGSRGSVLVYGDGDGVSPQDVQIYLASACFGGQPNDQCVREYFESYHPFDERLSRLRRLRDSRVVPVAWLLTEEQMKSSLVYNEMLLPGDLGNALHARLDGPGRHPHRVDLRRSGGPRRLVERSRRDARANPAAPAPLHQGASCARQREGPRRVDLGPCRACEPRGDPPRSVRTRGVGERAGPRAAPQGRWVDLPGRGAPRRHRRGGRHAPAGPRPRTARPRGDG